MPLARRDFGVDALLFGALPIHRVIDRDVILEGVGARDIVVIGVLATPDHSASLVFLTGDGFELHFDEAVFEAGVVFNANRVGGNAGLFEDVGFAGGRVVGNDFPFGVA